MLLIGIDSVQKGVETTITLNTEDLFSLGAVSADEWFSDSDNSAVCEVVYKSTEGNQLKILSFDLTQEEPSDLIFFSEHARDSFSVHKIILKDFDGDRLVLMGMDIPTGLGISFGAVVINTVVTGGAYDIDDNLSRVVWLNGSRGNLSQLGEYSNAYNSFIYNSQYYHVGATQGLDGFARATFWQQGSPVLLNNQNYYSSASDAAFEPNIYISGGADVLGTGQEKPALFHNGTTTILNSPFLRGYANSVTNTINGSEVIVGGVISDDNVASANRPVIWKYLSSGLPTLLDYNTFDGAAVTKVVRPRNTNSIYALGFGYRQGESSETPLVWSIITEGVDNISSAMTLDLELPPGFDRKLNIRSAIDSDGTIFSCGQVVSNSDSQWVIWVGTNIVFAYSTGSVESLNGIDIDENGNIKIIGGLIINNRAHATLWTFVKVSDGLGGFTLDANPAVLTLNDSGFVESYAGSLAVK